MKNMILSSDIYIKQIKKYITSPYVLFILIFSVFWLTFLFEKQEMYKIETAEAILCGSDQPYGAAGRTFYCNIKRISGETIRIKWNGTIPINYKGPITLKLTKGVIFGRLNYIIEGVSK